MRNILRRTRWELLLLGASYVVAPSAIGLLAWEVARHVLKLIDKDALTASLTTAGLALTSVVAFGGRVFDYVVGDHKTGPAGPGIDAAQREEWRVWLRGAVLHRRVRGEH